MEALLSTISAEAQRLVANGGAAGKKKLMDALQNIQASLETPEDIAQRLLYTIPFQDLTAASVRVCLDLGIYNKLSETETPLSVTRLAEETHADPILLGRFLRHQASLGMVKEATQDQYEANATTHVLVSPELQAAMIFNYNVAKPAFRALPEFLKETKYQNPHDFLNTPFQKAWQTDVPFWVWVHQHPEDATLFNSFMQAHRSNVKNCFAYLPLDESSKGWPADKPVFVDIGGGTGQQVIALREQFPDIPGKVVLQDLPPVIAEAKVPAGIEVTAYDFFTPQPVKGAKYYYLRNILHDHTDARALDILKNVVDAMTEESTLLIDEVVVPDKQVDWYVTQTDLAMMAQFGSTERTESNWRQLLAKAGLKVQQIQVYTDIFKMAITSATKQ